MASNNTAQQPPTAARQPANPLDLPLPDIPSDSNSDDGWASDWNAFDDADDGGMVSPRDGGQPAPASQESGEQLAWSAF